MDYEQKYKEALELARDYYKANLKLNKADENLILEDLFPELVESEDERIRKALICGMYALKEQHKTCFASIPIDNAIAWLEKQKVIDEEIIFRPVAGTDIRIAAKQALERIDIGKKVVLAFNGAYIPVNGKTVGEIDSEYDAWLKKQGEQK